MNTNKLCIVVNKAISDKVTCQNGRPWFERVENYSDSQKEAFQTKKKHSTS